METFTPVQWNRCDEAQQRALLQRPALTASPALRETVSAILDTVRREGDAALRDYTQRFDNATVTTLRVPQSALARASDVLSEAVKQAMAVAYDTIRAFHQAQQAPVITVETRPGVQCQLVTLPIDSVGLYIPGGSAPLFSTVLMLAIPAQLAGCRRIALCSPPPIAPEILYAATLCGVEEVYQIGGAQAIAALAFGTESLPKTAKIFGPGNAWVTEAKRQVSQCADGAAIDMPAGPSELLVIADDSARADFVAADLLSQAEHGPDSQVILLTPSSALAEQVAFALRRQLATLPRAAIIRQALQGSRLIIADDLAQCVAIANRYGPEHLSLQTRDARNLVAAITSAGSVFVGHWSPEAAGDYASGTNHVLPTYGYTATCSSLGLADFQKRMTVQELSPPGLAALAETVETLAGAEQLIAHQRAVTVRKRALQEER